MKIEIGMSVSLISDAAITGTVVSKAPRYWWPDLTDCWRVNVPGHGVFSFRTADLQAV